MLIFRIVLIYKVFIPRTYFSSSEAILRRLRAIIALYSTLVFLRGGLGACPKGFQKVVRLFEKKEEVPLLCNPRRLNEFL